MKDAVKEAEIQDISASVMADEGKAGEPQVYEIGYHIVSTVSEDAVEKEAGKVMDVLKKVGAEVVGERAPALIDLAYTIEKKIDGANRRFDTAYFGWVAFVLPADKIMEVKAAIDSNSSILRSLIIRTNREIVATALADTTTDIGAAVIGAPKREQEEGGVVSEEALDTALKQIEAEDQKPEEKI